MKFNMTKIATALALATLASGAHAVAVTGMTIGDTLTLAGTLGTDGYEGTFKFNSLANQTTAGASLFKGDLNGGVINVAAANPSNSFTTGFVFGGSPFRPNTTGPINIDINPGVPGLIAPTMTINSLPWGGYWESPSPKQFDMPAVVKDSFVLIETAANTYAYRFRFDATVSDPGGAYDGFHAWWILEGTMSTATATAPVPEASTYGMMLAGLGLVGAAVRRRRNRV